MTWGVTALWVAGIAAAGNVVTSVYSTNRSVKAQKYAADKQAEASDKALAQQAAEMRQNNQQSADMESILEAETNGEQSATLLSGATGIDKDKLTLGKGATLLGG